MTVSSVAIPRAFLTALIANALWMNGSEIFRYFVFIMPMMREALPQVHDVAPMNLPVFLTWGLWDTVLVLAVTAAAWGILERFGNTMRVVFVAATALWGSIFGILWIALLNMNLATPQIVSVALPLAWIELAVAVAIVWLIRSRLEPDRQ